MRQLKTYTTLLNFWEGVVYIIIPLSRSLVLHTKHFETLLKLNLVASEACLDKLI